MIYADAKYDGHYEGKPRLSYMICGARRTGSTYLGNLLWETGVLGKPFEYQLPENRQKMMERAPEGVDFWDFLRRTRTTENGVFGFKEVAPSGYVRYRRTNPPLDKAVYISRYDEVKQAISLTMAMQTAAFFSFQKQKLKPVYNYATIMSNFVHICETKRWWEEVLQKDGIEPLRLEYEKIGPHMREQIADYLGVKLADQAVVTPPLNRQGDRTNLEWAKRFRQEMEANGCSAR